MPYCANCELRTGAVSENHPFTLFSPQNGNTLFNKISNHFPFVRRLSPDLCCRGKREEMQNPPKTGLVVVLGTTETVFGGKVPDGS